VEPGRYPVAECGILLGRVHAVKEREGVSYAGTDLGQNVLARPVLYGAYHEVELLARGIGERKRTRTSVVGNICESGDFLARDRELPEPREGDIVLVRDAGAYGWSMSSSYNARPRAAEVLIGSEGKARLIRRRETIEDLLSLLPFGVAEVRAERFPAGAVN
jgi:diaminopimelate decarboxylase